MSRDYVIYLRKSVGRAGISRQRTVTAGHIEALGGRVAAEFSDTDSTAYQKPGGARPERAGFDEMVALVRRTPGLGIGAWHADRLIRSGGDAEILIAACAMGGHPIETPRGGTYDLSTAVGRKRLRGDANDAAFEVDHLIERLMAAQKEQAEAGEWTGGPRPFGYKDGGMVLEPAEARALATATEAVLGGVSLGEIARQWNAAGLRSTRGNTFSQGQVRRVLIRPRNAGFSVYQGEIVGDAKWPPAVDRDLWLGLVAMLGDPGRFSAHTIGRRYLLSGLVWCGTCGGPMTSHTNGGNGRKSRVVYACNRFRHVARDVRVLDEYVAAMVKGRLRLPDAAGALTPVSAGEAASITAQLAKLRQREERAAEDYDAELLTGRQVKLINDQIATERADLTSRRADLTRRDALAALAGGDPDEVWETLALGQKRAIIAALLRVTVGKAPRGRPAGWKVGMPYFDPSSVRLEWL